MEATTESVPESAAPAVGELIELRVEKLIAGGEGLGRFTGVPVFVSFAAPGDQLRVRVVERRREFARAEIVEVLSPGPGRRTPPCPVFGRCGGCDLQHLEEPVQLEWRARAAVETLQRFSGIADLPTPEIVAGPNWGYRIRTQLQVDRSPEGRAQLGYFERSTHTVVPISGCPILVPELNAILPQLDETLQQNFARRVDLAAGESGLSCSPALPGLPHGEVTTTVRGHELAFDARTFFQGHRDLVPALVEHAVGEESGDEAYDLYAGVGLFTLELARLFRRVTAIESDAYSIRYLRINARRNKRTGIEVVGKSVDAWIRELPHGVDRVLVDPPRSGLSLPVRRVLEDRRPRRLTYVSCHTATLARDLRELSGAFRVRSLCLLDCFPQTGHLEVVAQLEAR